MAKKATKEANQANRAKKLSRFCPGVDCSCWVWCESLKGYLLTDNSGVIRYGLISGEDDGQWIFFSIDNSRQLGFLEWEESDGDRRQIETTDRSFVRQVADLWRVDRSAACGLLWRHGEWVYGADENAAPIWAC